MRRLRAPAEENALLARERGRVQARLTRWREDRIARSDRLDALSMGARAEAIVKETPLAVVRDPLGQPSAERGTTAPRRVPCVGGRVRQVRVYPALAERPGGRLSHVDAIAPDGLPARALADIVILQPGCAGRGLARSLDLALAGS